MTKPIITHFIEEFKRKAEKNFADTLAIAFKIWYNMIVKFLRLQCAIRVIRVIKVSEFHGTDIFVSVSYDNNTPEGVPLGVFI